MDDQPFSLGHGVVQLWGVMGVAAFLGNGARRVLPIALEPMRSDTAYPGSYWCAYFGFAAFMAYAEGYCGFHCKFSPNVVTRSTTLRTERAGILGRFFAPLYCMELFSAPAHRIGSAWSFLSAIVLVVAGVKRLPPKPRAVVDAGVVTGLSVGIMSLFYHYMNLTLMGVAPPSDSDALGADDDSKAVRISYCPVTLLSKLITGVVLVPVSMVLPTQEPKAEVTPVAPPGAFMAGKSLVASVQDANPKPSLLWTLCPIHWSSATLSQVGVGVVVLASLSQLRRHDRACSAHA